MSIDLYYKSVGPFAFNIAKSESDGWHIRGVKLPWLHLRLGSHYAPNGRLYRFLLLLLGDYCVGFFWRTNDYR